MTNGVAANYTKSFVQTYQDAKATRAKGDDSLKHVRFGGKSIYQHAKMSGLNFVNRWRKQKAGAAVVFKSIENQFGADVAKAIFTRVTGSPKAGSSLTFGQLDKMNEMLKTNESTRGLYVGTTSANLDGNLHAEQYSDTFKTKVQSDANGGVKKDMDRYKNIQNGSVNKSDNNNWNIDKSISDQYIHKDFARDFMGSTFVYNGKPVVDANDGSIEQEQKRTECIQRMKDAGVPEEHWPVLSATLNQGLFQSHQIMTQMSPGDAPMPYNFGDGGSDNKALAGLKFEFQQSKEKPGVYDFVATTHKPMANVNEFYSDNRPFGRPDRTDPNKSEYLVQLKGQIDCNNPNNPITLSDGQVGYKAELDPNAD